MSRTFHPDDRIAHYRVVGPLGTGGMGEVYIAKDERLERSVALKVLPPGLVKNQERVRRFIAEAKSASSLNHPNIVTIYEIGHDTVRSSDPGDGAPAPDEAAEPIHYIAMELVTGETLATRIHRERADLRTLVGHLAQAAEGVAKAHAAGIVHRDLKPGNIMISKDGFTKVLDFGLAKLIEREDSGQNELTSAPTAGLATGAGMVMGTVGYMSPEQVQAKSADHRSDIFSMGIILYEAATRRRPFIADTDVEVMHQILKEKPPAVEDLNPEVPSALRRLIRRCLAKSPEQRLQSMKDLAIELREITEEWDSLNVGTTSSTSLSSGALGLPPAKRSSYWGIVLAAAAIGVAGLAFGVYSLMSRGEAPAPAAAAPAAQDLSISVLMSRNDLGEATLSADGRYLAYVTFGDSTSSLMVRQVRTGSDVTILADSETPIVGIAFSPDGDYLYYRNRDPELPNYSALFQVPSLGGTPRKVFFDVDTAPTFSPDGKQACFRRGVLPERADTLVIGDLQTGEERELARISLPESFGSAPAWSPDGRTIAVPIDSPAGGVKTVIAAIDVTTGESVRLGEGYWLDVNSVGWAPDSRSIFVSGFNFGAGIASQVYRMSHPEGVATRLTSDLDGYVNISLSADGSAVAAVRRSTVNNMWVAPPGGQGEVTPITFASSSGGSMQQLRPLPGEAVAFTAPRDGKFYVWRMGADGSDRRQLTTEGVFVINAFHAPGAGILYTQVDEDKVAHVWRMNADGTGATQLTTGQGEQIGDISPTGNALLFERWDAPNQPWILKLDGGEPYKIGDDVAGEASFAPDGQRLLITRLEPRGESVYPHRYIVPLDGGEPLGDFLLPPGAFNIQWTPDGQAVTYVDRGEGYAIMRRTVPDGEPEPIFRFDEGRVVDHNWHPDGSRMVIHGRVGQQDSLWELEAGETEPRPITDFRTGRTGLHYWAPDEPRLYFTYSTTSQDVVLMTGLE